MIPTDVECVYDALAETLDTIGPEKSELFLAKLALLLSHEIGNAARVLQLIAEATDHLGVADQDVSVG